MSTLKKPNILITNDDGIDAPGLQVLIKLLKPFGNIIVVAPDKGQSAKSHSITLMDPLRLNKVIEEDDYRAYSCSGTSVDCVKLALNEILDTKPDMLFSGINHGTNSSISIIYSGTMAAALEGSIHGINSIGLSVLDYSSNPDFSLVEKYLPLILKKIAKVNVGSGLCLNINFPKISPVEAKGLKVCRQAKSAWIEEFDKRTDPHHRDYYWLTGEFINMEPDAEDTDDWALKNNYISVVPVNTDFTAFERIEETKNILL